MIARPYAGILGLLAFTTVILRSLGLGTDLESAIQSALLAMVAFAMVGFLIGKIAERIVSESARATLLAKTDDHEPDHG